MNKALEVREFDIITCNPDYREQYHYLGKPVFNSLVAFIHEFTGSEENSDAIDFLKCFTKKNVGDVISIRNYVGLIEMKNGFQIQVLPKIDFSSGEDVGNQTTKRIFLKMLRSMKDFPCKVFNDANLKADRMNLYELFINMYLQEVRQILKQGLKSGYIEKEDNLHFYKGKLMVNEHIRQNLSHKERFYLRYDEFNPNRPENKLIKSTLIKLSKMTSSAENSKEIRQFLTGFELVEPSRNIEKDFASIKIDRTTKGYEAVMAWSRVFLFNKSFTTFTGSTQSRALLFPMEQVFESYVAQQLKKVFVPDGWEVSVQDKGYYLFEEPRRQFSLRPDIVIRKNDRVVVLDTKWKSLCDNEAKNYGISQSDMYQMYAYSKKYQTSEIWLIYPVNQEMRNHRPIQFDSGDGTIVNVLLVDVAEIETDLVKLKEELSE
ncbi:MAG: McrC family protein [Ruminococcus sp.]|nr:McrC family protein [Ruminococcus sp.]